MRLFRPAAAALVAVSLCAAALVAPPASGALSAPTPTTIETFWARAVFRNLNWEREAHGLPRLWMSPQLVSSAMYHNRRMARANTLSHQLPGELPFYDRERAFGYRWTSAGENAAVNPDVSRTGTLALEYLMYDESPPGETGHRLNILSRSYRAVGVGVLLDPINHRVWLTEDFGTRG